MKATGQFTKEVNTKSRKDCMDFLAGHKRYYTMLSWNKCTSYAHNVKIHGIEGIDQETRDSLFDLVEVEDMYDMVSSMIDDFNAEQGGEYTVVFNGRSSGYLVLMESWWETKTTKDARVIKSLMCSHAGIDDGMTDAGDFKEWSAAELAERVAVVQDFDNFTQKVVDACVEYAKTHRVIDVHVQKTVKERRCIYK